MLYSVNTPLTALKIENLETTCVTKTRINTMDAYVFYLQSRFNFPSWQAERSERAGVDSRYASSTCASVGARERS
jgi:hypothetical protein